MAIRFSDAATALMAGDVGLRRALSGAHLVFYTGTQPTSGNSSIGTSQPIIAFTVNDGVYVADTKAQWKVTFTDTTANDTITSIKIGGAAGTNSFDILGGTVTASATDDTTLAIQVAAAINANIANCDFTATSSSGVVTISAPKGSGTAFNSCLMVVAGSGVTSTYDPVGGGVFTTGVASSNGLTFGAPLDGASLSPAEDIFYIEKSSTETWKGKNGFGPATAAATAVFTGIVNGTTYTAGWARICASSGDDGSTATSGETGYIRVDFSVGTSGTDFVMSPTATFAVNTTSGAEIESVINSFRLKINKKMA